MNIKHIKGTEQLEVILNAQKSPLTKTSLGYVGETSERKTEDKRTINFVKVVTGDKFNQQ